MGTSVAPSLQDLYKVRPGVVDFVDVPEAAFVVIAGEGAPEDDAFANAIHALYAVSYGVHFAIRKESGVNTKVMPLEALWWSDAAAAPDASTDAGEWLAFANDARDRWRWQAMIAQPPPIDELVVGTVIHAANRKALPALDRLTFERWQEGLSAQLLHVGPYAEEATSVVRLHEAIRSAGYAPRGRHHEIYLGDPRRCAPEKLRTILRQPIAPAEDSPPN